MAACLTSHDMLQTRFAVLCVCGLLPEKRRERAAGVNFHTFCVLRHSECATVGVSDFTQFLVESVPLSELQSILPRDFPVVSLTVEKWVHPWRWIPHAGLRNIGSACRLV